MENCVFCRVLRKELPSKIVYENDHIVVLLAKDMEVYGHTLIIPKEHYESLYDTPENILTEIMAGAKMIANMYKKKIGATGMNLLHASGKDAQQSSPHFHLHLIPRFPNDGLDAWPVFPKNQIDVDEFLRKLQ